MTIQRPLLEKARAAEAELAHAEGQVQVARSEYHAIVRRMHLAGASLREIAEALDLSHQRVQQMVQGAGGSWWQRVWRTRNARGMACTFCKRPAAAVSKLIAGPKVFICDACVAAAEQDRNPGRRAQGALFTRAGANARGRCSFCRRSAADRVLLAGPDANICGPCLDVCRQILVDSTTAE